MTDARFTDARFTDARFTDARFSVRYRLRAADEAEARARADGICVEQTVEYPRDLLPDDVPLIHERILGRLERLTPAGPGAFDATISFADETAGADLPQLLNVVFGNTSLKPGVRVEQLELAPALVTAIGGGPRLGQAGLRELTGVAERPLLCTALKPMGLGPRELARLASRCALGGIDLIKDDHGLADQPFCPFRERVARCAEAVAEANARTGERCLYVANVTGPANRLAERAATARRLGAGGVLVAPGLVGWDGMRQLARDLGAGDDDRADGAAMPVICHPALLGSYLLAPDSGIAHRVLLGQLPRLAGADATIFPHLGGRFSFSADDCRALATGATEPLAGLPPIFPVPAGGMGLERVGEVSAFYGSDVILLIGGDLHRVDPDHAGDDALVARCRDFRRRVEDAAGA